MQSSQENFWNMRKTIPKIATLKNFLLVTEPICIRAKIWGKVLLVPKPIFSHCVRPQDPESTRKRLTISVPPCCECNEWPTVHCCLLQSCELICKVSATRSCCKDWRKPLAGKHHVDCKDAQEGAGLCSRRVSLQGSDLGSLNGPVSSLLFVPSSF